MHTLSRKEVESQGPVVLDGLIPAHAPEKEAPPSACWPRPQVGGFVISHTFRFSYPEMTA
jgi:hypothetical protein